jgi:D-alanyl-D-alanine carboxypeptidase
MFLRAFAALTRAVCTAAIMMVMAFGGGTALAEKYAAIVIDADTGRCCMIATPMNRATPLP